MSGLELFGSIGTAVAVVEAILVTASYIQDVKNAKREQAILEGHLVTFNSLISDLKTRLPQGSAGSVHTLVEAIENGLTDKKGEKDSSGRFKWMFTKDKLKDIWLKVEHMKTFLTLRLVSETSHTLHNFCADNSEQYQITVEGQLCSIPKSTLSSPQYHADLRQYVTEYRAAIPGVDDVLRLQRVSRLFGELARQYNLWLALYRLHEPTLPLFIPLTASSIARFLKFRTNWTSPYPIPVEAPRELISVSQRNQVSAMRIVVLQDGSSWLVVINKPSIYGEPWREVEGKPLDSSFVFVQAISFSAVETPVHHGKKCGVTKWEFGKWCAISGLPLTEAAAWVFDEDENSPYVLSLISTDGFIHTYSLSSTKGWDCVLKTPIINVRPDAIGFVASSNGRAIVILITINLQINKLANIPSHCMALMDLQCNQGNFTLLLNPDEKRYELPGHCAARFSNTHVAVFCRILGGFCRQVLIYPLQQSTRDTIWPAASLPLPAGTNNFVFSHITTPDLIFTILLTYSHHRLERFPDRQEGELHTAFTFSFDPSTANATFVEHSDEFSQNVVHDRYSIPQLSRSGHTLLHWGFGGEIKSEHLRLGGERKSSVLLKGSRSLKRGSFAGNIILDVDDRKGLVAWWWGGAPCSPVTMIKYGYCEKL